MARVILGQVGRLRRTVMLGRCRWCASGLQQVADGGPVFVGVCWVGVELVGEASVRR